MEKGERFQSKFRGQRVGKTGMEEEERKAEEWERKMLRNKQMEEREGSVMTKGQIKVMLQRTAQCIVWGKSVPKALPHFQKETLAL